MDKIQSHANTEGKLMARLTEFHRQQSAHEVLLLSPKSCANPCSDSGDQELDLGS
jgi:hypothetical protein